MKFLIILFWLGFFQYSFAATGDLKVQDTCSYKWQFEECMQANKTWSHRTIEDFVCIWSSNQFEIMSQIILDVEFKKVDKEVLNYLEWLEENKSYYFGSASEENFLKAIDEIEDDFSLYWKYWKKYTDLCVPTDNKSVVVQTMDCFWGSEPSIEAKKYFIDDTQCKKLILTKLEINKQVAYDILKLNKNQVKRDENKKYMQAQREKYDKLLEIVMVNIWYMERIWKKWPSKSKKAEWS